MSRTRRIAGREVADLRGALDSLDSQIVELLAERQGIVAEIARAKERHAAGIRDPARERQVIARLAGEADRLGVPEGLVRRVFSAIIEHSVALQASQIGRAAGHRVPASRPDG